MVLNSKIIRQTNLKSAQNAYKLFPQMTKRQSAIDVANAIITNDETDDYAYNE